MTNAAEIDEPPGCGGHHGRERLVDRASYDRRAARQRRFRSWSAASSAARIVWKQEMDESFGEALERWTDSGIFSFHAASEIAAPIASGTFPTRGMALAPCSMATAAAVSQGLADNLIRRAADVTIKERRPLVVIPRESPLSVIHLENLTTARYPGSDDHTARSPPST